MPSKHYPTFYQYVFPYREMASDAVRYEQRPFCSLSLFVDLLDFIDPQTRVLIVEGGAHIGDCTLLAAHKLPHARIIAFEPMRDAYELFRRSVVANQWDDRISVVRKALSDDGHNHVSITHYPGRSAASSASPRHKNFCSSADHHTCVVHNSTATTLTTALQGYGVVDVMKLSLEGLEMPALRGARALLAARRLCILFTNAKNVLLDAPRGAPVSEDFFSLMKEGDMDIWVVRTRDAFLFAFSRLATPADVQEVFDSKMVNGVRGVDYLVAVGRAAHCTYMQDVFDAFLSQS